MFVSIGGKWMYLWRAVDAEGEVLDCLVQSRRDKRAAKKLMRKLLKKQGFAPSQLVTDRLTGFVTLLGSVEPIAGECHFRQRCPQRRAMRRRLRCGIDASLKT
jgi:transposase-like protein